MTCLIHNGSLGRISDRQVVDKLFVGETITDVEDTKENTSAVWSIKNKYYSAKVELQFTKKKSPQKAGAAVFYSDNFGGTVKVLDEWHKTLAASSDDEVPEVLLLVVEKFACEDDKGSATQWALEQSVEIVDFSEDSDEEEEVKIFANCGQKRVLEALQTCQAFSSSSSEENGTSKAQEEEEEPSVEEQKQLEDFETLFSNLAAFKDTAQSLPDEERKKFAENVAISFYKSLGLEEDSD